MKVNEYINQFEEIYSGNPWYGKSFSEVLKNITPEVAVKKLSPGAHSIVDLVYHIITWKYFVIKLLQGDKAYDVKPNDKNDWRKLDYGNNNLWSTALKLFDESQTTLIAELKKFNEDVLCENVPDRNYTYDFLLTGLIQHDIYHLGQINQIKSILNNMLV